MKSRALICAIAAASLSLSSLSFAQGNGNGRNNHRDRDHDGRPDAQQHDNRGNNNGNRGDRGNHYGNQQRADQYYYNARGPEWRRGGRVPSQYHYQQYVVSDWRGHHLSAPPRGQQWVQVGGDYVLMAIATGVIVQLLLNQ
jgi:Ni/Co efflux regulator RcnB